MNFGRTYRVAVLPGDGIGPEIMAAAIRCLEAISARSSFSFDWIPGLIGGAAFDQYGSHFPAESAALCRTADAVLLGSVGGPIDQSHEPKWRNCERNSILAIRKEFSFFANLRSLSIYRSLLHLSPLRASIIERGIDILVVRELLGDIYFGLHETKGTAPHRIARDVAEYDEAAIKRIAHVAFNAARGRHQKVVSVDKANVLDTSRLWREVVTDVSRAYPDVHLEHMLVDNCAMQLVRNPSYFDVLLTPNLFGDILSDLISVFGGSLGLMPSASLSETSFGLYEPAGGSAPDIAGKGIANPIGQILSGAMMLRHSFGLSQAATLLETAVQKALEQGSLTADLIAPPCQSVSTDDFASVVCGFIQQLPLDS